MSLIPSSAVPHLFDETSPPLTGFAELKRRIKARGLLDRRARGYAVYVALVEGLFVLSLLTFVLVHLFWVQCLNAVLLAFVTAQMGFIGHDAGHRQIFDSTTRNNVIGLLLGNIQVGMSFGWWLGKHNAHHARPNEMDSDPDIAVPLIAFSEPDALTRRGFARFVTKYQAWLFFPLLLFVSFDLHLSSIKYLFSREAKHPWREAGLLALHYAWYLGLIFAFLPWWQALIFIVLHQAATGLYLGSVFAPNHKGMLVTEHNSSIDFLHRQVLTARNVHANWFTDAWYGGLNYQIEHHLFPSMPRRHLAQARLVIRAFCQQEGIVYYETSCARSYHEILSYLHHVGAPLRKQAA